MSDKKRNLVTRYENEYAYKKLYFAKGEDVVAVEAQEIEKKYGVHSVIKLFEEDFNLIVKDRKEFTHFNIQYCGHEAGKDYLILKIAKLGYFDGETEKPPVLRGENVMLARCLSVRNYVGYDELNETDFEDSLEIIKDVKSLKKAILRRYKNSLAHLSDEEKLSLGVSITECEIIKRYTHNLIEDFSG